MKADRRVLLKDRFPYAKDAIETMPKLMTDMYAGGKVPTTHIGRPPKFMTVRIMTKGVDQVPALLQQGELVIPKKHTPMVEEFLRQKNIYLPNMERAPKTKAKMMCSCGMRGGHNCSCNYAK